MPVLPGHGRKTVIEMVFRKFMFLSALLIGSGAAHSQDSVFDTTALQKACQQQGCHALVEQILASSDVAAMAPEERNSQLALLAAILIEIAKTGPANIWDEIARSLVVLAEFSTDDLQVLAFRNAALAVSRGEVGLFDTTSPFAVSPN